MNSILALQKLDKMASAFTDSDSGGSHCCAGSTYSWSDCCND